MSKYYCQHDFFGLRFTSINNRGAVKQQCIVCYSVLNKSLKKNKLKKKHRDMIGEQSVKPAAIDKARLVCGNNMASKLQSIPLLNNTVKSRIAGFSPNIKQLALSTR